MHGLRQLSAVLSARALVPRWRAPTVDLVRDSIFVGCDSTRLRNRNTLMRALARYGFRVVRPCAVDGEVCVEFRIKNLHMHMLMDLRTNEQQHGTRHT